jgi:hypothetical protein
MSMGAIATAVAPAVIGAVANKALGGNATSSSTEIDPYTKANIDQWEGYYQNSPVPQQNLDSLTAGMNPYQIEALAQAGGYAQGAGADQVAMMNLMGMNQAGVGNQLENLAAAQAGYGSQALSGAGGWIMNELMANMSDAKKPSGGKSMSTGGYGGGGGGGFGGGGRGGPTLGGDLKFKYDQGTFDQSYGNLVGLAQNAFDSFSNKTKTNNLFNNLPQLKLESQLLGGANTKVGQQSSLLDAMTNQQIVDFGAQQAQWAGGQANNAAMAAGQGNQNTAMGKYSTDVQAATSRANAAMSAAASAANAQLAARTQQYNALVGAASNMYGDGMGLMSNAGTSLANAGGAYGSAGDTFGNANTTSMSNIGMSSAAGNYINQYDQAALDRYNDANIYNQTQPGQMSLAGLQAMAGVNGGTTYNPSTMSNIGQFGALGSDIYNIAKDLPIFGGGSTPSIQGYGA